MELKSGRNLRGWFDLEEGDLLLWSGIFSTAKSEKSSLYRGKGRQKPQVFGFESFKFIDQKKRGIIGKTHKSRFGFISSLHHGRDVRML